jgi:hypothetical protein
MLRTVIMGAVSALTLTAAAADETVKFSSSCTQPLSNLRMLATWTVTQCRLPDIRD